MASGTGGSSARAWTRWQDWAAVVLGAYLVVATLWMTPSVGVLSTMIVLGGLLVITGAWSLAMPGSITSEYVHMLLGVLLFVSPWVIGYTAFSVATWTSWVVGALAVIVGAAALSEAGAAHRTSGMAGQH